jgi:hypothetical protein
MISKAEATAVLERMFAEAAGITRDQNVIVAPPGGGGGAPAIYSVPRAIISPIPARRVDGVTVLPNDERLRLRASVLPAGTVLKPGDYFIDTGDGMTRTIITAHLDAMGILWTCAVRRQF